jgi:predicted esterase
MNLQVLAKDPSPTTRHTHTIVFLHGRGDNAPSFASSLSACRDSHGRRLTDIFPSARWVFPQAPTRALASDPKALWPQWFDVWDVRDFASRESLQAEGLKQVVPAIRDLLAQEAAKLAGQYDRIVLAGISMGTATGVHVLFNLDVPPAAGGRLGAFVGFSGRCPFVGRPLTEMRKEIGLGGDLYHDGTIRNTPVLLEHCADDPLVTVQNGRRLRDTLRGFGAQVEWKEYPSGGHWFNSPEGIDDLVWFLKQNVAMEDVAKGAAPKDEGQGPASDAMDSS